MTNDMNDMAKLNILIAEARLSGIEVLPPDVNQSGVFFTPSQGAAIRFGLAAIKGVGQVAVESLLAPRQAGPFKSLADLCQRVDGRTVNRRVLEALIKSGACDCFGENRATMFAKIDRVLARAAGIIQDRQRGQDTLFGKLEERADDKPEPEKQLPEWPQHELLAHERELLGFYVTGHPLTPFVPILEKYALHTTAQLAALANHTMTRIGGLVTEAQKGISKKSGKPYAMVTLEDLDGSVQILCLNDNYEKFIHLITPNAALLVTGEVNRSEDKPKIFPQEIVPLQDAPHLYTRQVHLRLQTAHLTPADLDAVRALSEAHPGKCPLFLCLKWPGGEVVFIEANQRYSVKPSAALQQAVDEKFGEDTYFAKVDATLPQRAPRQWEKKSHGGNGGE